MLDIGFSELFLIAVVALVVIGPKDLPVVVKHIAKFLHELRGMYNSMRKQMNDMMDEAGVNDFKRNITTIIDLEGNPQTAYDVRELEDLKLSTSGVTHSASPLAGEATRLNERSEFSRSGEGALIESANLEAPSSRPSPARGEGAQASPPRAKP